MTVKLRGLAIAALAGALSIHVLAGLRPRGSIAGPPLPPASTGGMSTVRGPAASGAPARWDDDDDDHDHDVVAAGADADALQRPAPPTDPPTDPDAAEAAFCDTEGSLNGIARAMARHSSPAGGASHRKVQRLLRGATHFCFDAAPAEWGGIFAAVTDTLVRLLAGYGLHRTDAADAGAADATVLLELSVFGRNRFLGLTDDAGREDWSRRRRIVLQTEQVRGSHPYATYLMGCHRAPACVIVDFSDAHLAWGREVGFAESVLLLPFLIQRRFAAAYGPPAGPVVPPPPPLRRLPHRTVSVAFFGLIMGRRARWYDAAANRSFFPAMVFKKSRSIAEMAATYLNARVCLVVHSYMAESGGEYHRLSELGPSGCVPVVETIADRVALEAYQRCGGIVFAPYEALAETVEAILTNQTLLESYDRSMERRAGWWSADIQWDTLLRDYFE